MMGEKWETMERCNLCTSACYVAQIALQQQDVVCVNDMTNL